MSVNTAIILAGGKSSRMGFDKQEIRIGGKLIVDHIAEKLRKCFDEIIIVTNRPDLYKGNYIVAQDIHTGKGPLAGIYKGLELSKSQAAFVTACDMPVVNLDYLNYLKDMYEKHPHVQGLVTFNKGYPESMNAIYKKELLDLSKEILESELKSNRISPRSLIEMSNFLFIDIKDMEEILGDDDIFFNINSQEDLEKYKKQQNS